MHRAWVSQVRLNAAQRDMGWKCVDTAREVYNMLLAFAEAWYPRARLGRKVIWRAYPPKGVRRPGRKVLSAMVTRAKRTERYAHWNDVPDKVLRTVVGALDNALNRFHKPKLKAGFPRFKSQVHSAKSFGCDQFAKTEDRLGHGNGWATHVYMPKLGWIRLCRTDYIPCFDDCRASLRFEHNRWRVAVGGDDGRVDTKAIDGRAGVWTGVDLGMKTRAAVSREDGTGAEMIHMPGMAPHEKRRLLQLERLKARQEKGSKRYRETCRKINAIHGRQTRRRQDATHKMTRRIVDNAEAGVALEDLNIRGMGARKRGLGARGRGFNRKLRQMALYEVRRQIEYKAAWSGKPVHIVDRFQPSTKKCHVCDFVVKLKLSDRTWACPGCGAKHDRDLNAATNIALYGGRAARDGAEARTEATADPQGGSRASSRVGHPGVKTGSPERESDRLYQTIELRDQTAEVRASGSQLELPMRDPVDTGSMIG